MKKSICGLILLLVLCLSPLPAAAATTATADVNFRRVSDSYLVSSDGVMWKWAEKGTRLDAPVRVRDGVVAVSSDSYTVAWIDQNGTLWGEGTNENCQLGVTHNYTTILGRQSERPLEAPVRLMEQVQDVYANNEYMLALGRDGTLWGWGKASYGQLGPNPSPNVWSFGDGNPAKIMDNVVQFDSNGFTVLALKSDGTVWAWGDNDGGILGRGPLSAGPVGGWDKNPAQILDHAVQISLQSHTGAALKEDGTLWIWGDGGSHVGPVPETEKGWTWGPFQSWEGVSQVASSRNYAVALKSDGTLWKADCPLMYDMGGNNQGAVVKPDREILPVADQVAYTWREMYVTRDGSLYQWSYGSSGKQMDAVLVMSNFGASAPARNAESASDWAKADVETAKKLGLLTTGTTGGYRSSINRLSFTGLVVNMVEKALGHELPQLTATGLFSDAEDLSVVKAYDAGIIKGAGDGTFGAVSPITREQVASILRRAMDYIGKETGKGYLTVSKDLSGYTDGSLVTSWHADDVATMAKSGIMQGSAGKLSPQDNITTEQSIVLILRLYQLTGK